MIKTLKGAPAGTGEEALASIQVFGRTADDIRDLSEVRIRK